jgi:hypothetical protein
VSQRKPDKREIIDCMESHIPMRVPLLSSNFTKYMCRRTVHVRAIRTGRSTAEPAPTHGIDLLDPHSLLHQAMRRPLVLLDIGCAVVSVEIADEVPRTPRVASAVCDSELFFSGGIAMSKIFRLSMVFVLVAAVANMADSRSASAQRIKIGGLSQSNQNNQSNNDDDENENNDSNRRRGKQSNNQNDNQTVQQFQQLLQGGQNNSNQNRRSNQSGQFQGQGFGQQFQQQQGNQSGLRFGNWQAGKWQGSNKIQNWSEQFSGGQQPFSAQWYQDHPKAWKYNNNKANVWVVASLPGVYGWLGWGNVPPQYNVNYHNQNAQHFDHSHYGDWYPLGVYSLMAGPDDVGTRIVQLAVDRHGHVAGNYYDMISNSAYNVSGDVKQQSQQVYWSLNKNKFVRFRAPLHQLLQPYGEVTVMLPGGRQEWQFVRMEN